MEEMELGPNGGLIFCMELLLENKGNVKIIFYVVILKKYGVVTGMKEHENKCSRTHLVLFLLANKNRTRTPKIRVFFHPWFVKTLSPMTFQTWITIQVFNCFVTSVETLSS